MKLSKSKLWTLAISFAATLSIVGCEKKGQNDPPAPMPDPANAVVMPKANAIFVGDEFDAGNAHFYFTAFTNDLTFDLAKWGFKGTGEVVWIDFMADMPKDLKNVTIADGEYTVIDFLPPYKSGDVYKGFLDPSGEENGSFYATVENGVESIDMIVSGKMYIARTGDNYKVIIMMTTESGKELVYKYENKLDILIFGVPVPPAPFDGTFTSGIYMYFNDYYKSGYGNGMLELTDIPTDVEFGAGHILGLDINTPLLSTQKDLAIVAGKYTIDKSETFNKPMTFNAGVVSNEAGDIYGSYWVDINSEGGNEMIYTVVDGSFEVTDLGDGKFKIVANVVLTDGTSREGTFEGKIRNIDESCLSRLVDGDVNLTNLTKGMMVYRGIDIEYFANNSANWAVVLASDGIDLNTMKGEGTAVLLDINTPRENKIDVPAGDYYKIVKFTSGSLLPMTYIPGFYNTTSARLAGTWYMEDMNNTAPATSGTIKILKDGDDYQISFNFRDDYHYVTNGNKIDGSYTGKLLFLDATPKASNSVFAPKGAPYAVETVKAKGQKPQYKVGQKSHSAAFGVAR